MNLLARTVIVERLPEAGDPKRERIFLSELASSLDKMIRPRVVLDCSLMRKIDSGGLHLLLRCLEEAMKRNGDVRLAAVPEKAQTAFRALGIDRLFRIYHSAAEATESFRQPQKFPTPMAPAQCEAAPAAVNAA